MSLTEQNKWLHWTLTALCIVAVAVLCVAFNGGISVGASNHVGLLPVVRRLLDTNYLPGDFNISLRLFHHRVFAYLLAGLSMLLGEARAVIALHVAGAALLSGALWFLCRTLGLSRLAFLVAGLFLATGFLWTGLGLEENDFVGNAEVQPPLFAHAFVLLATAFLISGRYRAAAVCAGLTVLFHLQIGVIATAIIAPFYAARLREFGGRELARLAVCYLLPASPALLHLLAMLQRGLLKPAASAYSLAYYIDFRHPHHFALMSAQHAYWVAAHVLLQAALWCWLWRARREEARRIGVLLAMSSMLVLLALAHFTDYYLIKLDKFANLQAIRLSPLITVFGALCLLWLLNQCALALAANRSGSISVGADLRVCPEAAGLRRPGQTRRSAPTLLNLALLLLAAGWGVRVTTREEAEFYFGVRHYNNPAVLTGQRKRWVELCNWIRANTPRDAVFLTPPANEGFTVLTDRSNIVEFKINPDGALRMDEWFERLKDLTGDKLPTEGGLDNRGPLNKAYGELSAEQLLALGRKYGASYAVLPKAAKFPFEVLYENDRLKLVKLPATALNAVNVFSLNEVSL
jgi:hypothetical protein